MTIKMLVHYDASISLMPGHVFWHSPADIGSPRPPWTRHPSFRIMNPFGFSALKHVKQAACLRHVKPTSL